MSIRINTKTFSGCEFEAVSGLFNKTFALSRVTAIGDRLTSEADMTVTVSCFSKIEIGFTFLVPVHPGSPGQRAVKRVCVRACVCVCVLVVNM